MEIDEAKDPSLYDEKFFTAWEKFAEEIVLVFEAASADSAGRPLATVQTRYVLANLALAHLMKSLGKEHIAEQFHLLAEAMQDLVEGLPHPLFKVEVPEKKRGRHPDSSAVWRIRSNVCIGIELLMAGGLDEEAAISLVVKKHKKALGNLLRPNAEILSSIRTWLKAFANDEVRNEVALSSYKEGLTLLPSLKQKFSGDQFLRAGETVSEKAAQRAAALVGI